MIKKKKTFLGIWNMMRIDRGQKTVTFSYTHLCVIFKTQACITIKKERKKKGWDGG